MNRSIQELITYLVNHRYSRMISPKLLSQPTGKEFGFIFRFLYHGFDPNYKFGTKFEKQVVTLLKDLGYPFLINQSNLHSVGSAHAWPQILASLTWMVKLLTVCAPAICSERLV